MDAFATLAGALSAKGVSFVVIGVWGANYYAPSGSALMTTLDRDLFLPPDPANLLAAWGACEDAGLALLSGGEPLEKPRDGALAATVVERRALTRASDGRGLEVDLSLVMSGFEFDTVWDSHRVFDAAGISIPVARLAHIVESKSVAGRDKDRLFLETHRAALQELLAKDAGDRD